MSTTTLKTSSRISSALLSAIVGGHLIGLDDKVQLVIDFNIFNTETKIAIIEQITFYSFIDEQVSVFGFIDKTGKEIIPCQYDTKEEALKAMETGIISKTE
jgi:hypothetical protein